MTGASAGPRRLRVVTWNIRAGIGPGEPFPPAWWRHVRQERLELIGGVLRTLDADVVTLQEVAVMTPDGVVHDQPAELAELTGLSVRYAAAHAYPLVAPENDRAIGSAMWGNAILTRAPVDAGFVLGLDPPADDDVVEPAGANHPLAGVRYGDVEPGHREPRCVVGVTFDGIAVVTTHLTYMGHEQRRRQAEALASVAGEAAGPVIVTGDLNAAVGSPDIEPLSSVFGDAFAAVGVRIGDPRRLSCGPQPIDHVFVRGLAVEACRVATEAGDLSDHRPVVADLVIG